ncbi:hypothetical protein [Bifidobacterium avesanii]|uniref:Uncharacterized protein n=1 Tax=Bifidobacterium avesanii TaxID=1798157 RepID=A0A7K3TIE2_9BIFI|nr:hypothetical protein [Bifidobacterium avesanii]KAB8290921.1 hypothetical protein DSM100685_1325 [Bifidobacterium avesanii]NEG78878.1 hypothetical protein [Bifidobacterium avesanii]
MAALLQGFSEINLTVPPLKTVMTVTETAIRFNKATAEALDYPAYAKVLINERTRRIAVTPCEKDDPNAVKFSKPEGKQTTSVSIKTPLVLEAVLRYFPLDKAPEGEVSYKSVEGNDYPREKAVIFAVDEAVAGTMKHRGRRKASAAEDASTEE